MLISLELFIFPKQIAIFIVQINQSKSFEKKYYFNIKNVARKKQKLNLFLQNKICIAQETVILRNGRIQTKNDNRSK